jgi:cytochrome c553
MGAACCAALLTAAGIAAAQTPTEGNVKHGKAIAAGKPEIPAEHACASCHGDTGEGNSDANIPRLAGQSQPYLLRALEEYASGQRQNEVMTPIAKALKKDQRADVTAYYATLTAEEWKKPAMPKASLMRRGAELASVGSSELGVQGCMNCHGPQGRGLPPTAPYIAGQPAEYLADRLKAWRGKPVDDDTDPASIMAQIARHLGDEDVAAAAAWFAQQPPDPIRLGEASAEKTP